MVDTVQVQPKVPSTRPGVLQVLWTYRKRFILGAAIGLGIGIGIVLYGRLNPTFTSTATLMFPSAPMSAMSMLTGGGGNDLPSMPLLGGALMVPQPATSATTAGVLIQSHTMREHIATTFDLQRRWKLKRKSDVFKRFDHDLQCQVGKNGELYVGYRDEQKELAFMIADEVVKKLRAMTKDMGMDPAERSMKFLSDQVDLSEMRMQKAQTELMTYQKAHRIVDITEQSKALADQYAKLMADYTTAKIEANAAMREVNLMANNSARLIQACMDPTPGPGNSLGPLYQKVTDLESSLILMRDKLTPNHPDVKDKEQALQEAQRQLKSEIQRQLTLLKSGSTPTISTAVIKAAIAEATVAGQQSALQEVQQQVTQLPQQQGQYMRLQAELETTADTLKLYRGELEKSRIISQSRDPLYEIVDNPEMPISPDKTGRGPIIVLLFLFCIGLTAVKPIQEWLSLQEAPGATSAGGRSVS